MHTPSQVRKKTHFENFKGVVTPVCKGNNVQMRLDQGKCVNLEG